MSWKKHFTRYDTDTSSSRAKANRYKVGYLKYILVNRTELSVIHSMTKWIWTLN